MILKTKDGRIICPSCGHPMYLTVVEYYYSLPADWDHDEGNFKYNIWDAGSAEEEIVKLECYYCDFAASPLDHRRSYYDSDDVDLDKLDFVEVGDD